MTIAQAPATSAGQLEQAVRAAGAAFPHWSARAWSDRAAVLARVGERLRAHIDELAALLTAEQGKPLAAARAEIIVAAMWCDGVAQLEEQILISKDANRAIETRRVALGVVAAIVPWNFPVGLAFWKIAPALLAGNSLILKPAPTTPLTTLRIGELIRDLLPDGVLNILSGDDALGPMLTAHPGIAKISFTGSTAVGKDVMRAAAYDLKRVTLELGGNDPAIVFPDVTVDEVVPAIFWAAFRNSGQFCVAAKRLYVHEAIYAEVADALVAFAATIGLGQGTGPGVQLGPLQNRRQFDRVNGLLARARAS
jgi:acyl-CoA reductase-like NAD-dependent aldehyde dehydrogenase